MASESVLINSGTQTPIGVDSIGGTLNIQTFKLNLGADGVDGAFWDGKLQGGTIATGSIVVTAGTVSSTSLGGTINAATVTVTSGTISNNMLSGTLNLATAVVSGGTINAATAQISGGTLSILTDGTLSMLKGGTINASTAQVSGGTLDLVKAGTISMIQAGTISNSTLNTGTLNAGTINAATINTGTVFVNAGVSAGGGTWLTTRLTDGTSYYNASGGGATVGTINVSTVNSATINTGTINSGTINAGTFTMTLGTLNAGTINAGTMQIQSLNTEFTGSATAGTATIIASQDISNYRWLSLQLGGTFTGTVNLQFSNDNSNFFNGVGIISTNNVNNLNATMATNGIYNFPIQGRFAKVVTGAWTSGTVQGWLEANTQPSALPTMGIVAAQSGNWTIGTVTAMQSGTITSGSIVVTAGTVIQTTGTLNTGTINSATINTGTINSGTINAATINTGTINLATVTMTIGTLTAGTVNASTVNSGTINSSTVNVATINAGTFRIDPLTVVNTISNVGTTGTAAIGTLIGTSTIGAGTGVYITGFHILVISGTPEVNLAFGTQKINNQVIAHGLFPAGGGIARDRTFPHAYGTTASPLTYEIISGAGTVSWEVDYFLHT